MSALNYSYLSRNRKTLVTRMKLMKLMSRELNKEEGQYKLPPVWDNHLWSHVTQVGDLKPQKLVILSRFSWLICVHSVLVIQERLLLTTSAEDAGRAWVGMTRVLVQLQSFYLLDMG